VTFEVEAGGTTRRIDRRDGRTWLDGHPVDVDAVRTGHAWSILLERRSYEVSLVPQGPGELTVHVNGRAVTVRVQRFGSRRAGAGGGDARGAGRVVAPMPGRIAKVLVRVGETVAARQGLVVVEAMKMENELRSPRAGRVTEVRATEGALVEGNAVLVVIE
jgi:biotin carboxyl carrier protein